MGDGDDSGASASCSAEGDAVPDPAASGVWGVLLRLRNLNMTPIAGVETGALAVTRAGWVS